MKLSPLSLILCLVACTLEKSDSSDTSTSDAPDTGDMPTTGDTAATEPTAADTGATSATEPTTAGAETDTSDTAATDTATTDTDTTDTDTTTGAACECTAEDCGAPTCGPVLGICGFDIDCLGEQSKVQGEAALQCTLEALRDRTPGGLKWREERDGGVTYDQIELWIQADGTAYVAPAGGEDMDTFTGPDGYHTLQDSDYFAGCLAEPDPLARFQCLRGSVLEQFQECVPRMEEHGDP